MLRFLSPFQEIRESLKVSNPCPDMDDPELSGLLPARSSLWMAHQRTRSAEGRIKAGLQKEVSQVPEGLHARQGLLGEKEKGVCFLVV